MCTCRSNLDGWEGLEHPRDILRDRSHRQSVRQWSVASDCRLSIVDSQDICIQSTLDLKSGRLKRSMEPLEAYAQNQRRPTPNFVYLRLQSLKCH
jgi:hypothetical protein